jgi:hypothetical protein
MFGRPPTLSDVEIDKYARQMVVAEDPLSVIEKMRQDRLSIDEAQTLRATYPDIYMGLQTSILKYIEEVGPENLSFARRLQVGILFDAPTDPSLLPRNMVAFSRNVAAMPTMGVPAPTSPQEAAVPSTPGAPTPPEVNMRKVAVGQIRDTVRSNQSAATRLEAR